MAGPVIVFVFGTLRYPELLRIVAGEEVPHRPARLKGWKVSGVLDMLYPMMEPTPGAVCEGLALECTPQVLDRLVHYEDAYGYLTREVTIEVDGGQAQALIFVMETLLPSEGDWSLERWIAGAGPIALLSSREVMEYYGRLSGAALRARIPQIEARAQSRYNAQNMPAPQLAWNATADQVVETGREVSHAGYFRTETLRLRHPRFDGGMSDEIAREVFVAVEAVIVLPYDPVRDRILLVEQFRMGPYRRGAKYPWVLEPVAGRIDLGETPETTARRETVEEAGLTLHALEHITSGYATPGYSTEYFHVYLGLCDLPDGTAGHHGEPAEHEDIRTHVLEWNQVEDLLSRGEADNMPLVLALTWLSRERSRLRASG